MRTWVAAAAALGAVVLFVASWALLHQGFWARDRISDTPVYERYGDAMVRGEVPYRDFAVEYPPAALPAFVLPSLLVGQHAFTDEYDRAFELLMLLCGLLAVAVMAGVLVGVGAGAARLVLALGVAALAPLALGSVVLSRFDLWPAALTVVVVAALMLEAPRFAAGALALAVAAKLYPGVLVPLAAAWVWKRHGRREALVAAGVFGAVLLAIVLPFVLLAPDGVAESLWRQLRRPLQIESLGAALLVALDHLGAVDVEMSASAGSQNIAGAWGAAVGIAQSALQFGALAWVWLRFARGPADDERLLRFAAAAVVAFVALGKVLSPQFMIWLVPLVPLVGGRRGLLAGALLAVALVLTQLWFPFRYWDYAREFDATVTALVLMRNVVLLALLAALVWPLWPRPVPGTGHVASGHR